MKDEGTILDELVKAKENIKRKFITLKTGEANVQKLMSQTFKPIIDPLTKISDTTQTTSIETKTINESNLNENYQQEIENWFHSADLDKTYGPKKLSDGNIILGDKEVKFIENFIIIDGTTYSSTSGLIQLLFLKNPLIYSDNDLEKYKSILIQTSAHLTLKKNKIKKCGAKYKDIICKLFPSGGQLSMKLQKHNLVYWDNPNELVDRLQLLLASKAAGNTDCFTKFAWAVPLKSKSGKEVTNAMSKILLDRTPKLLQIDNGKEFYNTTFDALMDKYNIHKYSTFSIMKACIVERFNRTLKEKMFREFTARGSHEWISILPLLLSEYNNSKHRTIGMTPVQADAEPKSVVLRQHKINNEKIKFNVGDNVRISTQKGVFTKGYLPNWSTEIFKINKINKTLPVTYQLQDYMGKPIAGCFYS
ncbi:hypothetical protein AGLY_017884, partial [Aphis glycines]